MPMPESRRQLAVSLTALVAVALVVAGTQLALYHHRSGTPDGAVVTARAASPAALLAGTASPGILPAAGDCPHGAQPYLNITRAHFVPALADGTHFRPGTYRITLTGTVVNETTGAIRITALTPEVGGQAWPARVSLPASLPADGEAPVRITGTYTAHATAQAVAGARLSWDWAEHRLASCGAKGLVEDD